MSSSPVNGGGGLWSQGGRRRVETAVLKNVLRMGRGKEGTRSLPEHWWLPEFPGDPSLSYHLHSQHCFLHRLYIHTLGLLSCLFSSNLKGISQETNVEQVENSREWSWAPGHPLTLALLSDHRLLLHQPLSQPSHATSAYWSTQSVSGNNHRRRYFIWSPHPKPASESPIWLTTVETAADIHRSTLPLWKETHLTNT